MVFFQNVIGTTDVWVSRHRLFALILLLLLGNFAIAKDLSLKEIRTDLLGKDILILGTTRSGGNQDRMLEWHYVTGDDVSGFKMDIFPSSLAPASVKGKSAAIVAVDAVDQSFVPKGNSLDAFGKTIDDSKILDPMLRVIAKVSEDGTYVGAVGKLITMKGRLFRLSNQGSEGSTSVDLLIQRLIGKTLFKAGFTRLFSAGLSLEELLNSDRRDSARDFATKNLTPLKVIDAKILQAENAVVVKVALPNMEERLLVGTLAFYDTHKESFPSLERQETLYRLAISVGKKIPSKFSGSEISAIKNGTVFRGMSEDALYWSWGYPDKDNDWGRGGTQLIFSDNQYVYLEHGVVRDWQKISR